MRFNNSAVVECPKRALPEVQFSAASFAGNFDVWNLGWGAVFRSVTHVTGAQSVIKGRLRLIEVVLFIHSFLRSFGRSSSKSNVFHMIIWTPWYADVWDSVRIAPSIRDLARKWVDWSPSRRGRFTSGSQRTSGHWRRNILPPLGNWFLLPFLIFSSIFLLLVFLFIYFFLLLEYFLSTSSFSFSFSVRFMIYLVKVNMSLYSVAMFCAMLLGFRIALYLRSKDVI
jgi:hypothetical protein